MVRWLFFILLLINLLVLLWGWQRSGLDERRLPPFPDDVPAIRLMSELDTVSEGGTTPQIEQRQEVTSALPESAAAGDAQDPGEVEAVVQGGSGRNPQAESVAENGTGANTETECVQLGPFASQADAVQLLWELEAQGLNAEVQVEGALHASGFWVLLPLQEESAAGLISRLDAAGIEDVLQFSNDALADALSVGLYSDRSQAEKRRAELSAKGFAAIIRDRTVEESMHWVRLKYATDYTDAKSLLDWIYETRPLLRFPPPACSNVANAQRVP